MRWKEILIGSAITLVVTVVGGLLVYFITQNKEEPLIENLSYQIDKQVSFEGKDNQVSIGALKFANIGNNPAKNIIAEFHADNAKIIEFKLSNAGGVEIAKSISENKHYISLKIKNLIPDEIVSATYLLDKQTPIKFNMRSERTIGKEGSIYRAEKERSSILNDFLGDFVPFLMIVAFVPLIYILKYLRAHTSRGDSKNNMAFVLLHTGATSESMPIFESAILEGADGSHALSNYASALAINGDTEKAQKYIKAARFLARTNHEKAMCDFNNSIIKHALSDMDGCQDSLEKSLNLSKSEIKSYINSSKIWEEILSNNDKLSSLVNNA